MARADVLAELMRRRDGIAVSGTHGKTTTAHLIVEMLDCAGEDPTYVVGGQVRNAMRSKLGAGSCLVAEADESDASFLHLQPVVAVVTNIDNDHLSAYGGNLDRLRQAFVEFAHNLPFYGLFLACADDPGVAEILPRVQRRIRTYGFSPEADYRGVKLRGEGLWSSMEVVLPGGERTVVTVNLPGRHNALNALAVVALGDELGIDMKFVRQALVECRPLRRRFELLGDVPMGHGQVTLVDDYAHHPREVAATLQAAREAWPGRRLVAAFQPHRYTPHARFAGRPRRGPVRRRPGPGNGSVCSRRIAHFRRRRPGDLSRDARPGKRRAGIRTRRKGPGGSPSKYRGRWRRGA